MNFSKDAAKSCTWGRLTPCSDPGWGLPGWRAALLERDWDSWWIQAGIESAVSQGILGCTNTSVVSKKMEAIVSIGTHQTTSR